MRFVYSGLVFCDAEGVTIEKSTLKKTEKPLINEIINLNRDFFKIWVSLKRTDNPILRSLFKDIKKNELVWNCHHPKALAEVIYDGETYKGFGYAETLILPIKPWSLPIDELRWGRFLSDSYTLIWINWIGEYPINKIFFNGIEYNDAIFSNEIILFNGGAFQLKFSEIQLIRKAKLSGLFAKMKFLKIFCNQRILNSVEIKYKARASLNKNSFVISNGWSLFEIVTWGK
jgi:hypothetical protein